MKPSIIEDMKRSETTVVDMGQACGKFYIIKDFTDDGKLARIDMSSSKIKAGHCKAMLWDLALDMANHKLERGSIPRKLSEYMVGRVCPEDRSHIEGGYKSCIDALGRALVE